MHGIFAGWFPSRFIDTEVGFRNLCVNEPCFHDSISFIEQLQTVQTRKTRCIDNFHTLTKTLVFGVLSRLSELHRCYRVRRMYIMLYSGYTDFFLLQVGAVGYRAYEQYYKLHLFYIDAMSLCQYVRVKPCPVLKINKTKCKQGFVNLHCPSCCLGNSRTRSCGRRFGLYQLYVCIHIELTRLRCVK